MAGNFLKTMEEMLECRICLCLLDDPKGLQCQHSYCKDCLDDLLKFKPDGSATLSCVMKCEGTVCIEANKTTNQLSAPYQLKGILDMYKMQNASTSTPNSSCRGAKDCKNEAAMYCFACYNLYCASCKCNNPAHLSSHFPVKFVEKYNQLMPICKLHDAIAKHICCRTEMICVYCRNRGHLNHHYENIEDQTKRVKDLLSNEEGNKGEIERLKENTKNNYEVTKKDSAAIRDSLVKLLRNRTILHGLKHMSVANNQSKGILSEFDNLLANHLGSYPDTSTNDLLKDINLDVNMELFVKKHFITNEYTKFLSTVPTLNIDMSDMRYSHPVGSLDVTTGASRSVSVGECSSSVRCSLDRFNIGEDTSSLLVKLENILKEVKDGETTEDESSLAHLFESLSIEEELLGSTSVDNSVRPKTNASSPVKTLPVEKETTAISSLSCPVCGSLDIADLNSFLEHLVVVHNVVLPVRTEASGGGLMNVMEVPRVVVPKAGDRIIAMWGESRWQYFTACIRSFHPNKAEYEIDWDDGDSTGRMVGVEHIALDRVPDDNELNIGTVVLFPQGMYHAGATQRTGGKRYHQGVITEIFTDMRGVRRYSGHHTKTERDGKYCTYRGYSHEFLELTKDDFRLAPNLFDVIQLPSQFKAKEHVHPLSLITNLPGVSWFCHQCVTTKCSLKHYQCAACQYDLCLDCIKEDLKTEITRNS